MFFRENPLNTPLAPLRQETGLSQEGEAPKFATFSKTLTMIQTDWVPLSRADS